MALVVAIRANRKSDTANRIAVKSNEIAEKSARIAVKSNEIAEKSARIAQEALNFQKDLEAKKEKRDFKLKLELNQRFGYDQLVRKIDKVPFDFSITNVSDNLIILERLEIVIETGPNQLIRRKESAIFDSDCRFNYPPGEKKKKTIYVDLSGLSIEEIPSFKFYFELTDTLGNTYPSEKYQIPKDFFPNN
ncbi:hypothetical protein C943_03300 [Mariniradius saccharolyticus AK6]|uniref:Uncharacterized protein n=1 Tax=Mariniradius saccharolyticus AK6 TaxID=1239962 RepID=M7XJ75_9BACT|nr:hypothetical protein C943_03300 [Mariniradius saccharolyticus AK6]